MAERQVAPTIDGIRADHVARYRWAAQDMVRNGLRSVQDCGCGVGYGSWLMHKAGLSVWSWDKSSDAVEYGNRHYNGPAYSVAMEPSTQEYDATTCFEVLEHIDNPSEWLRSIKSKVLYASVPNEDHFPWRPTMNLHKRHYTEDEFRALLEGAGWDIVGMRHQEGPESDVGHLPGRTLVAKCAPAKKEQEDLDIKGKHITILGMGPSLDAFTDKVKRMGGSSAFCDEVWGINALGEVYLCDRIFHMDDVRIQEARAAAKPQSNIANMVKWLKVHPGPIYTCHVEPGYAGLVRYPLEDVVKELGHAYFNSTVAYAVALAIYGGARRISLFGVDFTLANSHHGEQGRACVEYWLAVAKERGIAISLPQSTSLMDACEGLDALFYGFRDGYKVRWKSDGHISVEPRDELTSVEEIEERYDHSKPVNPVLR